MLKKITVFIFLIFITAGITFAAESVTDELEKAGFAVFREKVSSIDFTLKNTEGKKVSLKDYRGKTVMLNFWATWCPPCRSEMPSMEKLSKIMDKKSFEILAVNIQEKKHVVVNFLEKNNYTFPVVLDVNAEAATIYQVRSIPTTYIIDKEGYITAAFAGAKEWDETKVVTLLKKLASE